MLEPGEPAKVAWEKLTAVSYQCKHGSSETWMLKVIGSWWRCEMLKSPHPYPPWVALWLLWLIYSEDLRGVEVAREKKIWCGSFGGPSIHQCSIVQKCFHRWCSNLANQPKLHEKNWPLWAINVSIIFLARKMALVSCRISSYCKLESIYGFELQLFCMSFVLAFTKRVYSIITLGPSLV